MNKTFSFLFFLLLHMNSPCIVAGQHDGDGVRHHPLPVVVTDPGVLPWNPEQQVCKTHMCKHTRGRKEKTDVVVATVEQQTL